MPAGVATAHLCSMGGVRREGKDEKIVSSKDAEIIQSFSVIHDILLSFPEIAGRLMSIPLMGLGGIAEVSTTEGKPTQTVSTAGTWSALHCSAGSSQNFYLRREGDADLIC